MWDHTTAGEFEPLKFQLHCVLYNLIYQKFVDGVEFFPATADNNVVVMEQHKAPDGGNSAVLVVI